MYVAALTGPEKFGIIDASTGIKVNTVNTGGKIINGPVGTGDNVTVIIQRGIASKMGKIYNMPSGSLQTQFAL